MRKCFLFVLSIILIIIVGGFVGFKYLFNQPQDTSEEYPLGDGETPQLILPFKNNTAIYGITPFRSDNTYMFPHYGIDYCFNATTQIYAPAAVIVYDIKIIQNDYEVDTWQINFHFILNEVWNIELYLEPWAYNESSIQTIYEGLSIKEGDTINSGDLIGMIIPMGEDCRVHISVRQVDSWKCPYSYLTTEAKVEFDGLFSKLNTDIGAGITGPCN